MEDKDEKRDENENYILDGEEEFHKNGSRRHRIKTIEEV